MDIVWHQGQSLRRMEMADNGDFKFSDKEEIWVTVTLNYCRVVMRVAGKITDKFPGVVDNNVELTFHFLDYNDVFLRCLYTPTGLQCVHVDSGFLDNSVGKDIEYRSEEGMQIFIDKLISNLAENCAFREIINMQ